MIKIIDKNRNTVGEIKESAINSEVFFEGYPDWVIDITPGEEFSEEVSTLLPDYPKEDMKPRSLGLSEVLNLKKGDKVRFRIPDNLWFERESIGEVFHPFEIDHIEVTIGRIHFKIMHEDIIEIL
jgi:hypothetical protein